MRLHNVSSVRVRTRENVAFAAANMFAANCEANEDSSASPRDAVLDELLQMSCCCDGRVSAAVRTS